MDLDWSALWLSLKVAGWATAINLVLGVALGALLARRRFPGRELLDSLLTLPMVLPPTVLGYYLLVLIGRNGPIGAWLQSWFGINLVFTWQAAVIAAAVASLPLVFKPARAAFEEVDGQLEQAARTLGVSEAAVFFRITLPLAWRGILAGLLLAFARAMGEFGATLMVAGSIPGRTQTLSIAIYEAVQAGQDGKANALVILTSVVCIVILLLAARLVGGRRRELRDVAWPAGAARPAGGRPGFCVGRIAAVHAAAGGAVRAFRRRQEPDFEGGGWAATAGPGSCTAAGADPV